MNLGSPGRALGTAGPRAARRSREWWQAAKTSARGWQTYTDPQSGRQFPLWEGHYTYPGSDLTFIPTYSGGMFEGLMPNEVVPETSWGPQSFGLADVRTAQVQEEYQRGVSPGEIDISKMMI